MNHPTFNIPSLEAMSALLPSFEFTDLITSNDFGAVYLANQVSLERNVAVKVLAPHISGEPEFQQRFESTARSMARLNHPNLISVFDSGRVEGMLYFIMEYVPGNSLAHSTKGQRIDFRQTVQLIQGICSGLAHAHDHRIIHGELNPSNILLNQKAEPKIGNFGTSRTTDATADSTNDSQFIAPEILTNPQLSDHRSDIYSIGAILYELVTGQPHRPDAQPPSGSSYCGAKVDAIWRKSTDPNPDQRFQDARSLSAALSDALSGARAPITTAIPASQRLAVAAPPAFSRRPIPSSSAPKRLVKQQSGFINWKLLRNLVIIAGLLYAISLAWENLKSARIQRDKEIREARAQTEAAREKANEEAARLREIERVKRQQAADAAKIPQIVETPEESLARLRDNLAAGKRTEMPVGSVRNGDNDYLLVSEPMSWPDAVWFAEKHGGHLAIPNATANLTWLVGNVSAGNGIWIGAARSGRSAWALADGSAWKPEKEPTGIGQYLAADKHGFLRAENAKTLRPFVIQWHRDGSNPGSLAALLAATRSALSQANPVLPPGTRTYGTRHYLFVSRPLTWRKAVEFAEQAGGNLAAPSETAEVINLEEMTHDITAENGIWLGGFLKGDHWLWITGQPWKTAKWAEGGNTTNPDSALIHLPGKGWAAQNISEPASGFIIEWSKDRKSVSAQQIDASAPENGTSTLTTRARDLIKAADAKRTGKLAANARKFSTDLDIYLRGLSKSEQLTWGPQIEKLNLTIENQRVPSSVPRSSGIKLSDQMAQIAQSCSQTQDRIDMEFIADAEKLRIAYVAKLRDAQTQAKQAGQPKLAETIGESLNKAGNLEGWVESFGVELQPKSSASKK